MKEKERGKEGERRVMDRGVKGRWREEEGEVRAMKGENQSTEPELFLVRVLVSTPGAIFSRPCL